MSGWVWLNGQVVPEADARVSIWDRGFLYGDGVFETLRVYGGRPFRLPAHLARLRHGIERLAIAGAPSPAALERAVDTLLARDVGPDALLRITVTRGVSAGGWHGPAPSEPTVVVALMPSAPPADVWYEEGAVAVWCDVPMMAAGWWPADIKHCNWLPRILARAQVDAAGADEGFLRSAQGTLAEGLTSNVFVVRGGVAHTPPVAEGVLPGVTRAVVLGLAQRHGVPAAEASVPVETLARAEEIFYTNAGVGLAPVVRFQGQPVGAGRPGSVWRTLAEAYRRETGR